MMTSYPLQKVNESKLATVGGHSFGRHQTVKTWERSGRLRPSQLAIDGRLTCEGLAGVKWPS